MTVTEFQKIAPGIPSQPGIYKYFDAGNVLLYVGKAKNLRKRISSYFSKTLLSYKTYELVKRIARIEFTIVNSEQDAFLLENSLIKQFRPRFNINLKDDKTYPYIVIKKEPFPRVFLTRRKTEDGSEYLGPYTSVKKVRELLQFIRQTIPLRTCSLLLSDTNIQKRKFKVCLEYHLGNCKGPCEGLQSADDYNENLAQVRNLLKGKLSAVIRYYKKVMKQYAAEMAFEKAALIKKKIEFLQNYQSGSVVVSARAGNLDVFFLQKENDAAYINYLMVRNGTIIQTYTGNVSFHLDEPAEDILVYAIELLRSEFNSDAPEIVVPFAIQYPRKDVKVTIPKAGEKKKLLSLSEKNVAHFIREARIKTPQHPAVEDKKTLHILENLQADLRLPELPVHIECFDNSNFQGSYPVSVMVCFKNGLPSKKDYRRFNVKTVQGINDFATMKEVVYRRYKRLKEEGRPLPQLVIIDGGKGQLNSACDALEELGLKGKITLISLAKNEEEVFFSGDPDALKLPYQGESLQLIRRIRDEAHRFGIIFHRNKRNKEALKNELEKIPGIGKSTADALLKQFRSVKNIRELIRQGNGENDIGKVIGIAKARILVKYFSNLDQLKHHPKR